ncbi:MAG: hypothetical protein ACOYKZ_04980 [Chlamydiia bacterium]
MFGGVRRPDDPGARRVSDAEPLRKLQHQKAWFYVDGLATEALEGLRTDLERRTSEGWLGKQISTLARRVRNIIPLHGGAPLSGTGGPEALESLAPAEALLIVRIIQERKRFLERVQVWAGEDEERQLLSSDWREQLTDPRSGGLKLSVERRIDRLPDCFDLLPSLASLDLSGCPELRSLPPSLGTLSHLRLLDLRGNTGLAEWPDVLRQLGPLCTIDISGSELAQLDSAVSAGSPGAGEGPTIVTSGQSSGIGLAAEDVSTAAYREMQRALQDFPRPQEISESALMGKLSGLHEEIFRDFQNFRTKSGEAAAEGLLSFAAVWYSDRFGGETLQVQRPKNGSLENPAGLWPIALACTSFLENKQFLTPAEAQQVRHDLEEARSAYQRGSIAWNNLKTPLFKPNDIASSPLKFSALSVDQDIDARGILSPEALDRIDGSMIIPLTIQTDFRINHRILAQVRQSPDLSYELTLYNAGWGTVHDATQSGLVFPAMVYRFNKEDLGRALVLLMWAEKAAVRCENIGESSSQDSALDAALSALSLHAHSPTTRQWWEQLRKYEKQQGRPVPVASLMQAACDFHLREPLSGAPACEPQRSGSCKAKSVRVWLQNVLGGSSAPHSRLVMALLDAIAADLLIQPPHGASPEDLKIRRFLGSTHATYRQAKALSQQGIDGLEKVLRVWPVMIAQRTVRAQHRDTEPHVQPLRLVGLNPNAFLKDPSESSSAKNRKGQGAPGQTVTLQEKIAELKAALIGFPALSDHVRAKLPSVASAKYGDYWDFEHFARTTGFRSAPENWEQMILIRGLDLLSIREAVLTSEETWYSQDAMLEESTLEIVQQWLSALKMFYQLAPRPGFNDARWEQTDAAFTLLPEVGEALSQWDQNPTPLEVRRRLRSIAIDFHNGLLHWIKFVGLHQHLPADVSEPLQFEEPENLSHKEELRRRDPVLQLAHDQTRTMLEALRRGLDLGLRGWTPFTGITAKRQLKTIARLAKLTYSLFDAVEFLHQASYKLGSSPFTYRTQSWDLDTRSQQLKATVNGHLRAEQRDEPPSPYDLRALSTSSLAMETPGLSELLTAAVEQGLPFEVCGLVSRWRPPLGAGAPPHVQGDLIALGGAPTWARWIKAAQANPNAVPSAEDLNALCTAMLAGLPFPVPESHLPILEQMGSLLETLLERPLKAEDPTWSRSRVALLDPLLEIRLKLLEAEYGKKPIPADRLRWQTLMGNVIYKIEGASEPRSSEGARPWQRWAELRRGAGIEDPDRLKVSENLTLHLGSGLPAGRVSSSRAASALAGCTVPRDWIREFDPTSGNYFLATQPQIRPRGRMTAAGESIQIEWDSSIHGRPRKAIIFMNHGGPSSLTGTLSFPQWSGQPDEPNAELFPTGGAFLGEGEVGSLLEDERAQHATKKELSKLPGIFGRYPSILGWDSDQQAMRVGYFAFGSLEETAELTQTPEETTVSFPDGECIPLNTTWKWEGLAAIGNRFAEAAEANQMPRRAVLRDLFLDGAPIRGTVRGPSHEEWLELDSGWRVAPDRRDRLPTWLADLPSGTEDPPKCLALPLAGKQGDMGLLVAFPGMKKEQSGHPGQTLQALMLRVLPSGDILPEPETSPRAIAEALEGLVAYMPLLAQRLMAYLGATNPALPPQTETELMATLRCLADGGKFLKEPAEMLLKQLNADWKKATGRQPVIQQIPGDRTAFRKSRASPEISPLMPSTRTSAPAPKTLEIRASLHEVEEKVLEMTKEVARLHEREEKKLRDTLQRLPAAEASFLRAGVSELLTATLLQTWFRADQAASLAPWRELIPTVSSKELLDVHEAITELIDVTLMERSVRKAWQAVVAWKTHMQEPDSLASDEGHRMAKQAIDATNIASARMARSVSPSLIRQEWFRGLLAREAQLEAFHLFGTDERAHVMAEVPMGGGKTSLLNPARAFEMAEENLRRSPTQPAPVFLVVPDNLEEDLRRLCLRQGWELMGRPLPFLGSAASKTDVLAEARRCASQGLPLTLTQSAWNFAWLEALSSNLRQDKDSHDDLACLAHASILLDEADEALSIQESFNLQRDTGKALPLELIIAANQLIELQLDRGRAFNSPLDEVQRHQLLMASAPDAWTPSFKEKIVTRLLDSSGEPLGLTPEERRSIDSNDTKPLVAMALLVTKTLPEAAQLSWLEDFGPQDETSLGAVPYQYAHWPSNQSFSDPFLLAALTVVQTQNPAFWTIERTIRAADKVVKALLDDPFLRRRLENIGCSPADLQNASKLHQMLADPEEGRQIRSFFSQFILQSETTTSGEMISLNATGAPLRARTSVASSGTAPTVAKTPTVMLSDTEIHERLEDAQADLGILHDVQLATAPQGAGDKEGLDQTVRQYCPHIVIDPNGLLDHEGAVQMAYDLAKLHPLSDGRRPLALTWSAGTAKSAPQLRLVLPSRTTSDPPSSESLAQQEKVVVYQQAQCRGTDLKPRNGETGILYLVAPIPLRKLKQAAARMRGLVPDERGEKTQSLTIVVSPTLAAQIATYRARDPSLFSDMEALAQVCFEQEQQEIHSQLPQLLEQELTNLAQAGAIWAMTSATAASQEESSSLNELQQSLTRGFRVPTLDQLLHPDKEVSLQKSFERKAAKLEELLVRLGAAQDQKGEHLLKEVHRLQDRIKAQWVQPSEMAKPLPSLAVVKQIEAGTERQIEVDLEKQTAKTGDAFQQKFQAAQLKIGVSLKQGLIEGTSLEAIPATAEGTGIEDFEVDFTSANGPPDTKLLPSGFLHSPFALQPWGITLPADFPERMEPLLLHLQKAPGQWEAILLNPQEVAELKATEPEEWARKAEQHILSVTSLSGTPLTGPWGPEPNLKDPQWQAHLQKTLRELRPVRVLFGASMPSMEAPDVSDTQWLMEHPYWAKLWIQYSPPDRRPARLHVITERPQ